MVVVPLLIGRTQLTQVTKQQRGRTDCGCKCFLGVGYICVQITNEHAFNRHRGRPLVKQRARLQRSGRIGLRIIDIAHPIQITGRQQAGIDHVLLTPKLEGQVEKYVRMFLVDFAGDVADALHRSCSVIPPSYRGSGL